MFSLRRSGRAACVLLVFLAACNTSGTGSVIDPGDGTHPEFSINDLTAQDMQLVSGSTCDAINTQLRAAAQAELQNYWEKTNPCEMQAYTTGIEDSGEVASADDSGSSAPEYSTQNSQVAGVLEPDTVFTNGELIAVVDSSTRDIEIYRAWPVSDMAHLATISGDVSQYVHINFSHLILEGETLYGFGSYQQNNMYHGAVVSYDLANPAAPRALAFKSLADGWWNEQGRLRAGRLLSVFRTSMNLDVDYYPDMPDYDEDVLCRDGQMTQAYQDLINDHIASELERLAAYDVSADLPVIHTEDLVQNTSADESVGCENLYFNPYTLGSNVTVVIDSDGADLTQTDRVLSLMEYASTLYLNQDRLILSSGLNNNVYTVRDEEGQEITASFIHVFDAGAAGLDYQASAVLPGQVPSSFAIDENEGKVRVVTEIDFNEADDESIFSWTSDPDRVALHILELGDGVLTLAGQIDSIIEDEAVYAVRYIDDKVYLVTASFYIDPLFVIDTSTTTSPQILGQLEYPGITLYAQALSDGRLLGLGWGAECQSGSCWYNSTSEIGLFDVSSGLPSELDREVIENVDMDSFSNHLAVHFDAEESRLYVPTEEYSWDGEEDEMDVELSVRVYEVAGDTITQVDSFGMEEDLGTIQRTLHFRNTDDSEPTVLVVVGEDGIKALNAGSGEPYGLIL